MATLKQKKAFKEIGVNGGNISKAMRAAGYSESTSKRTDKLTNTQGWKELTDKYLPDDLLVKVHLEGLQAEKENIAGAKLPDYKVRGEYLDKAYKVKGSYAPEKSVSMNVNINPQDPKALALAKEYEDKLKEQL